MEPLPCGPTTGTGVEGFVSQAADKDGDIGLLTPGIRLILGTWNSTSLVRKEPKLV